MRETMRKTARILAFILLVCIIGIIGLQAPPADAQANLIVNGNFANGMQGWQLWDAIVHRIQSGTFEFYRSGGVSAAVLQKTGQNFVAGTKLKATFRLGTSDYNWRRVTVILHSDDWSDLQACTFMINAYQPLAIYEMEVFTQRTWTNATISFYSSRDYGRGWTQLDDVTLRTDTTLSSQRVRCIDPYRAAGGLGTDSANYISNGTFASGTTNWSFSGEYMQRVQSGVLEMYTKTGGPAANVFQDIGFQYLTGGDSDIGEVTFNMGNSSSNRKRVSVLLHEGSFVLIYFCTFWVEPNSALAEYRVRVAPDTHLGSNYLKNIAFYVSPFDNLGWIRLDDITLRERPGLSVAGTECHYPGSLPAEVEDSQPAEPFMLPTLQPTASGMPALTMPLPELAVPQAESAEESGAAEGSFSE
jgi:hypothetical protein